MDASDAKQAWDERYSTTEYVWNVKPNQFVEKHLAEMTAGVAIDLGAGEGRNAVWLAMNGWDVTAVDISPVGLAKADRLADEAGVTVATVEADANTYTPDRQVDLVIVSYLQLPPEQRKRVVENARTWLKPGATFFLIAHDQSNIESGHGGPSDPGVCYTPQEVVSWLDGLDVSLATVAERHVETEQGQAVALDTLVIASAPA